MARSKLWLDYRPVPAFPACLRRVTAALRSPLGQTAHRELLQGIFALSGIEAVDAAADPCRLLLQETDETGEGFRLTAEGPGWTLSGSGAGLLYGVFSLLEQVACSKPLQERSSAPRYPLRMLDHWDNGDGSIERGYAGRSFFFADGRLLLSARTTEYARLLASCGLNGCCINNVNVKGAALGLLTGEQDAALDALSRTLDAYHVGLWISVSFAAPMEQGGLPTADPQDPAVQRWWRNTVDRLYRAVPLLRGFLVKADSEGRPGPHSYGRSQAEGANLLARALQPYGGMLLWRCFVYNCAQDWRDPQTDRARAQCDAFLPLDGAFDNNVLLQVKNGPMDFQIREPVSPLLGRLQHTNTILEFQLTQEYTGQQQHVCCLLDMLREVLDFPFPDGSVAERISAVCAVSNTGDDENWCGHDLAAANLYGFGRLCWDPSAEVSSILRDWSHLTFGLSKSVTAAVTEIQLRSRRVYERYTAPLGLGWLCAPGHHYGPSPEGYEYDRWGTYHRATHLAIGVERGPGGSGFASQYPPPLDALYGSPDTCPEELLLFFHRLPFAHRLRDGRTLLQTIYDDHFEGYEEAEALEALWHSLRGAVPEAVFQRVCVRFREQLRSAREWRDVINSWLYRLTLIPDEKGRQIWL